MSIFAKKVIKVKIEEAKMNNNKQVANFLFFSFLIKGIINKLLKAPNNPVINT